MTLIKHYYHEIKRGGGPAGYLYNLRQAIGAETPSDVTLEVSDSVALPPGIKSDVIRGMRRLQTDILPSVKRRIMPGASRRVLFQVKVDWLDITYSWLSVGDVKKLFECDYAVVHSTLLADRMLRLCPALASKKMVLITHSPTFLAHELACAFFPDEAEESLFAEPFVEAMMQRELHVMQESRCVLWPCVEAQEGYPAWWDLYKKGKVRNIYAETGVQAPSLQVTPEKLREQWGIAPDKKIVLFIGRPHPHKGFDRFVDWADHCRKTGKNEYVFVHCGDASGSSRDLSALHLAGYVKDNGAAYLAAQLVVLPNRHSYFDLGVLEALSLGAKFAMSATGGHKHLLRVCPEIPTIPDGDAATVWPILEQTIQKFAQDDSLVRRFKEVSEEKYSLRPFYKNLVDTATQLKKLS